MTNAKNNTNLDLAYQYFMRLLRAFVTDRRRMNKMRYEKYRKIYLAQRFKKSILKSTQGKVLKEVKVHGKYGTYNAKRWFRLEDVKYKNDIYRIEKNQGDINRACKELFGINLSDHILARLGGAHGNEKVILKSKSLDILQIEVQGNTYQSLRVIKKDEYGDIHIYLGKIFGIERKSGRAEINLAAAKGKGTAINAVYTIIKEIKILQRDKGKTVSFKNIQYISGDFLRSKDGYDGYFKYARMGFDGGINKDRFGVNTVQEYIQKYGLAAWKTNGVSFTGKFNLQNKKQLQIFKMYFKILQRKEK